MRSDYLSDCRVMTKSAVPVSVGEVVRRRGHTACFIIRKKAQAHKVSRDLLCKYRALEGSVRLLNLHLCQAPSLNILH